MDHKRQNQIIAAAMFLISLVVYGMTVADTTSYWDCGEFITCSYILGVPHPPGTPLYILVGRVFTMLPFFEDIGLRVNIISVILSAFTVMFTYLIIVRLMKEWKGLPETIEDKLSVYTAGVVGALGFAFSDSFWFNAVEAEVYAVSMFFTAITVWLVLVWLDKAENSGSDKILLLIVYLTGLATGVHLLTILALPTIFMIIYFKKAELRLNSFLLWTAGAVAAFLAIYPGIVKGIPWVMSEFGFLALVAVSFLLLFGVVYAIQNRKRVLSLVLLSVTLLAVGYSTYTVIYIRSGLQPAINENNPNNPERFASYLNREQYGDIPLTDRREGWDYQIKKMYVRYFGWQFIGKGNTYGSDGYIAETLSLSVHGLMGLPFIVGLVGMYYHFRRDWHKASAIMALFIMTGVAIAIYLNQEDPQPRERDYAYVGSFFAFAIWIGIGAGAILETVIANLRQSMLLRKIGITLTIIILLFAVPLKLYTTNYHEHDRTGNYVAYDYSYNILQSCEPDAIIFTNGDNDTFPLWFLQYVYGIRKDVRVVNLSLLNTPWYIKQLRDEEPKVPITFTDAQIDRLGAQHWPEPKPMPIPVRRDKALDYLAKDDDNSGLEPADIAQKPIIDFELSATKTLGNGSGGTVPVILVQDIMVIHIIGATQFKKPIYFAVTVSPQNMLGMDNRGKDRPNFLRMDGLAYKVMPYGGPDDFISFKNMHENLFENFQYRNLDNPEVYYNPNIKGLLQNYRAAFLRLTSYYQTRPLKDGTESEKAISVLDRMNQVMPESVIPLRNYQISLNFGRMYAEAGRPEELQRRLEQAPEIYYLEPADKIVIAEYYWQFLQQDAKAESLGLATLNEVPDSPHPYRWLTRFYAQKNQYKQAVDMFERWLAFNPADRDAQAQLRALKSLAAANDSSKSPADGTDSTATIEASEKP